MKLWIVKAITTGIVCGAVAIAVAGIYSAVDYAGRPDTSPPVVVQPPAIEPPSAPIKIGRFESVEAYFKDGNPNPLTHRFGLPPFERDVSARRRLAIIKRDGGRCLVCGSTDSLEVDHRIALMNNGDNSDENLGTLCDRCHTAKTRYDWSIQRRRRKMAEKAGR